MTVRTPFPFEQFVSSENEAFVEAMMQDFKKDKQLVDSSWWPVLERMATTPDDVALLESVRRPITPVKKGTATPTAALTEKERLDNMRLSWLVRAYEMKGHYLSDVDPLKHPPDAWHKKVIAELDPSFFGFTEDELDTVFAVQVGANFGGLVTSGTTPMTLRDIIATLKATYCGKIGFEFMHSGYYETRVWFRQVILQTAERGFTPEEQKATLSDILKALEFERFLHMKFATHKRFGLDGAESFIALMNALLDQAALDGTENFIIGMPHRGRLNVLVNVCGKPLGNIFNEFEGRVRAEDVPGLASGDVKYHLGFTNNIRTTSGKDAEVTLLANPSHLETINPFVLGRAHAKLRFVENKTDSFGKGGKTLTITVHGDAAFCGQGICYESMGLRAHENFKCGGTVHVVVNNQIGFTADPHQSHSGPYCSDTALVNDAPVLHVNGDSPLDVIRAARIAIAYRQKFHRDIIIDLVCYRRYGHNEVDQPLFTQPGLYKQIASHPHILKLFGDELVKKGVLTAKELQGQIEEFGDYIKGEFEKAPNAPGFHPKDWNESPGEKYINSVELARLRETGLSEQIIREVGERLVTFPKNFSPAPLIAATYERRREALQTGNKISWSFAEQLAFGSLLLEGVHVRVTGRTCEGSRDHSRFMVLYDSQTGSKYIPLQNLHPRQASFTVSNSSVSEYGVCGFETGFSMENPKSLCIWEANTANANAAQIVFDQFLCCGEAKWIRECGLVVSLAHGWTGVGESTVKNLQQFCNARLERYLQLSDCPEIFPADFGQDDRLHMNEKRIREQNWQVCFPSTPSNYFHLLRRQVHREFRKPLIIFHSAMERVPNFITAQELSAATAPSEGAGWCASSLRVMAEKFQFRCVHDDPYIFDHPKTEVKKIVLCTGGSMYGALQQKQQAEQNQHVAIIRLEQLAPFPWEGAAKVVGRNLARASTLGSKPFPVVWAQEEPKNMGAFAFIRPRVNHLLKYLGLKETVQYVGRPSASGVTTLGSDADQAAQTAAIVDEAFRI